MPDGPWTKYAQQPAAAPTDGPWSKYADQETLSAPVAPPPAPAPSTAGQRLLGVNPVSDTLSSVGTHLKNLVSGPYHAFTDAPQNAAEQRIKSLPGNSGLLGQLDLGAARMFAEPTAKAVQQVGQQAKAGNLGLGLKDTTYDAQGNYHPTALSSAMDAVPIAGPWARSVETEAHQKGALPALAGLGVDAAAPTAAGKAATAVRGLAPGIAEGALNISKADRGFGKTPGRALLDETTGVRPASIEKSAGNRLSQLNSNIDQMAQQHAAPVDITPAIEHVDQATQTAKLRNNPTGVAAIGPVKAQLTENPFGNNQQFAAPTVGNPNATLSPLQTAEGALNLKRGLRDQFVKNWNPDAGPQTARDVARGASGVIDRQLDQSLGPDFRSTNQRISSLIPVQDAAESIQRNAGIGQKIGGRLKAHTGALSAGIAGGMAGHAAGGTVGGLLGGAAGLIGPEIVGSPTAQMVIARGLNSKIPTYIAPPVTGAGVVASIGKRSTEKRDDSN